MTQTPGLKKAAKTHGISTACDCPGCSLWLRLEAERLDRSYLKPKSAFAPNVEYRERVVEKVVYKPTPDDKRLHLLFFNAGRYAAGARDHSAVNADAELKKELHQ